MSHQRQNIKYRHHKQLTNPEWDITQLKTQSLSTT